MSTDSVTMAWWRTDKGGPMMVLSDLRSAFNSVSDGMPPSPALSVRQMEFFFQNIEVLDCSLLFFHKFTANFYNNLIDPRSYGLNSQMAGCSVPLEKLILRLGQNWCIHNSFDSLRPD
uniref:Uncharacterized protein n=1 Tax=Solanum lycopersicum TaxID=4081 RepID=A0A3Q7EQ57_SOLLC